MKNTQCIKKPDRDDVIIQVSDRACLEVSVSVLCELLQQFEDNPPFGSGCLDIAALPLCWIWLSLSYHRLLEMRATCDKKKTSLPLLPECDWCTSSYHLLFVASDSSWALTCIYIRKLATCKRLIVSHFRSHWGLILSLRVHSRPWKQHLSKQTQLKVHLLSDTDRVCSFQPFIILNTTC